MKKMKAHLVPGFSSVKDLNIVYEWGKTVPKNGVIVELGSMVGRTAVAFAESSDPSVKIYCIDYFQPWTLDSWKFYFDPPGIDYWVKGQTYDCDAEFKKFTSEFTNIIQLKLPEQEEVYPYDKEQIDLLFIDSAHKNPSDILNITYFRKYLTQNALICGHDYSDEFPDVKKNVKLLQQLYKTDAILYQNSTCWAIRIR